MHTKKCLTIPTREKNKRTNNDLQNITKKVKYRATRTPLNDGMNVGVPEWYAVPAPLLTAVL